MNKTKYMYSTLLELSKSEVFEDACKKEDIDALQAILLEKNILKEINLSKAEGTTSNTHPQPEPRIFVALYHVAVELVVAGYVGAVVVTMVIGKNKDRESEEGSFNNFNIKTPILKNTLALVSKFSSSKFTQSVMNYFNKIEDNSFSLSV